MTDRVQPGQPLKIPARSWNDLLDVKQQVTEIAINTKRYSKPAQNLGADLVLVRNDSGGDLAQSSVLGIDGPVIDPAENLSQFQTQVCLKGVTPTLADHAGRFIVLSQPLKDGAIGLGWASGVFVARIDMQSEDHVAAGITDGDPSLLTSGSGPGAILWAESGTGPQWAIVRLGGGGDSLWAELTSNDGASGELGPFSWREVDPTYNNQFQLVKDSQGDPITGSDAYPLYSYGIFVASTGGSSVDGTVVRLERREDHGYQFDHLPLPEPKGQHQVLSVIDGEGAVAWDYVRAHD